MTPRTSRLSALGAEIRGGFVAALLVLPASIGLGAFAFTPLGPSFFAVGVAASLASVIVLQLAYVLLRENSPTIIGPKSPQAFMVAMALAHLMNLGMIGRSMPVPEVLGLLCLVLLLAGLIQALLAALGVGRLIAYVPYPVVAGFQNGTAIALALSQIGPILGIARDVSWLQPELILHGVKPLSIALGVAGIALMFLAPRVTQRIPALVVSLFAVTGLYYGFSALGYPGELAGVVGELPAVGEEIGAAYTNAARYAGDASLEQWLTLLSLAASIAFINTLDMLLSAKVVEPKRQRPSTGRAVLLRNGLANALAALAGALPGGIHIVATNANHAAGGRSRISLIAVVVFAAILVGAVPMLIALLPRVAIAALLAVTAYHLFDRWSVGLITQFARRTGSPHRHPVFIELLIVIGVAGLILFTDIVSAVAAGVALAVLLFLFRVSRSVVYRSYRGDAVRSRKARDMGAMARLAAEGNRIAVLELEGPIFFGSADKLGEEIARAVRSGAEYLILDFRRVTDLDTSGARFLIQAGQALAQQSRHLLVCHVDSRRRLQRIVESTGIPAATSAKQVFADADQALEWAEDRLLGSLGGAPSEAGALGLEQLILCRGFDAADLELMRGLLEQRSYRRGEQILRQGEPGSEMYVVSRGMASVRLRSEAWRRDIRIVTFAAGTVFGELSLMDAEARVASVQADTDVECYVLSRAAYDAIVERSPQTAIKLTKNLALELAGRLRQDDKVIVELER